VPILRYALYTRKSDERREVTEKSTGEQSAQCRPLAQERGLIVREFEESKSAKIPGVRPLFRELLRLIERGKINAILCWKVDRLARNMEEGGMLAQLLIDGKLREIRTPHSCHRPGDNILPLVLETATSTQYSLDLKITVERGLNGHFERGGWNACAPQGYRNERDRLNPKVGVIAVDEPRFTLIHKGWDMLLTDAYSPAQVVQTLSDVYGYRTRPTLNRGGTKLSRSQAYKLFANPFYAGYTWYKGQIRQGTHPAMVTEAEFAQVQAHLGKNLAIKGLGDKGLVQHAQTREFAYTGLMRCGYCSSQITAEHHLIKAAGGTRKPYCFYRCADSKGACTKQGLAERWVEEAIEQELSKLTLDPELCLIAEENLLRALEGQSAAAGAVYTQQNVALEDLEQQQSRLLSMWLRGMLTDEARYQAMEAKLLQEKQSLLLKAGACRDELERMRANTQASFSYLRYARDHFLVGDARRKREIAHALAVEYVFYGREKRLEIALKPLLTEVVQYAEEVAIARENAAFSIISTKKDAKKALKQPVFEPQVFGSGSSKLSEKSVPVLFGRNNETEVEPSIILLDLLRAGLFLCSRF